MGPDPEERKLLDLVAAAYLLIASLAVPASAAKLPDCVHVSSTSLRWMPDLDAVRDCQEKVRRKLIGDARNKGKLLSYQRLEKIDDQQRAQVRDFLANSGTIIEGSTKSDRGLGKPPIGRPPRRPRQSVK